MDRKEVTAVLHASKRIYKYTYARIYIDAVIARLSYVLRLRARERGTFRMEVSTFDY